MKIFKNELKDLKKVSGYEVNIFIEESNYQILKNKAKRNHLTIDEYIEKLIKKECIENG